MMTRPTSLLAAALAVLFCCAGARAEERRRPDAWITAKVKSALASHKNVSAIGTNVDTKDGVVTLRGKVDTQAEKDLSGRYAEAVQGVRRVDNQLVVKGDAERDDAGVFDRDADRDADRVAGEADRPADEAQGMGDRAMGRIGDAALTSRVKAALAANRSTSGFRTNVDTKNGRVTLRGTARSEAERDLAEEVASGVNGVRSVENKIELSESR